MPAGRAIRLHIGRWDTGVHDAPPIRLTRAATRPGQGAAGDQAAEGSISAVRFVPVARNRRRGPAGPPNGEQHRHAPGGEDERGRARTR